MCVTIVRTIVTTYEGTDAPWAVRACIPTTGCVRAHLTYYMITKVAEEALHIVTC